MSNLIKSSRIILGESSISISADVTKPPGVSDDQINRNISLGETSLAEQAENAALEILDNAETEARQIIAEAKADAKRMEQEVIEKANQLYDNKRSEAQDEGYAQGFDAGQSEAQVLIDEALMIKEELQINKIKFVQRAEQDIIRLCFATVKNIINREIQDESYIIDIIKKGIDHLTYTSTLVVRVSEYDYDYVSSNTSKVLAMVEGVETIDVKKDLSLDHGDCVIDTDTGSIDVGINSQIEQVEKIYRALLAGDSYDA